MKGIVITLALLLAATGVHAYDIRDVPLPSPTTKLLEMGYTSAEAAAILNGTKKFLWASVPRKGWTDSTYLLQNRMATALGGSGLDTALSNVIINVCKAYARDPQHCAVFAAAVSCAESSCGQSYDTRTNSIFGVRAGLSSSYSSRTDAVLDWVRRYNGTTATNGWYVANEGKFYQNCKYPTVANPARPGQAYAPYCDSKGTDFYTIFFYSYKAGVYPASEYCLSEASSTSSNYCPNGYANSKKAYMKIYLGQ